MGVSTTQIIELPAWAYERFLDLQDRILREDITTEMARYEAIEILSPFWDHEPEPWEATEIVLKRTTLSILTSTGQKQSTVVN